MAILASTLVVTSRRSLRNFSTRVYIDSTKSSENIYKSSENINFFYDKVGTNKFSLGRKFQNRWDWSRSFTIDWVLMGFMTWLISEPHVNAILAQLVYISLAS